MLDLNIFRDNPEVVKADLKKRNINESIVDEVVKLDAENRAEMQKVEEARAQKNAASEKIAKLDGEAKQTAISEMKTVGEKEKIAHEKQQKIEADLKEKLANIPNLTHESTPAGPDESGNTVIETHGTPRKFDFEPKDHVELGVNLGILNIEDAVRMSGSRFAYLMGEA
ncbi:serine--tRNA ligase, partial [Candidatus Peregrinibacteria bacterium]|nr:serine--tRNA ligase [Candidatus Peregrinibacteria bacterium]